MSGLNMTDIQDCAARINSFVRRTPIVDLTDLARAEGLALAGLVGKAECLQHTGSFKYRGASNRLHLLTTRERKAGVVTYSSGNHAAALATVAGELGISVIAIVPDNAPKAKVETIQRAGARIIWYDPTIDDRIAIAKDLVMSDGLTLVPPYDDYRIMAGQGTLALELLEQAGPLDVVVVPVGGGGLIAGVATAITALCPHSRVIGVEPAGADDTARSLAAGRRLANTVIDTIADGLRTPIPGELTFPIVNRLVSAVVTVDDVEIATAMARLDSDTALRVEPSGAVALAGVISGRIPIEAHERVGVVISGGNVDRFRFDQLIATARQPKHVPR